MYLSIIFPAHNEEKRIGKSLDRYCESFFKNTEIIVVLNACLDNTIGVVKTKQKKYRQIKYVDISEAIGKGGAVREGFKLAKGDYIGFVDADLATSPEEYKKLLAFFDEYDGVIASRYAPGSKAERTCLRKIISFGFRIAQKILFHLPFYDTQCGAKIFKKEVILKVLPALKVNDMIFDIELLYQIRKAGHKVKEVATVWERKDSSALLGTPVTLAKNSIKLFFSMLKLRFRI